MGTKSSGEIGELVRARRTTLGFTQQRLAAEAGVSRKWIVDLESGKATVQFGSVLAVLAVLAIDAGELNEAAGDAPVAEGHEAQLVVGDRIRARARGARFGVDLLESGVAVVGLDEAGELVRYRPDGTTSLVA
jgi:y4mF family transcriptional regulator